MKMANLPERFTTVKLDVDGFRLSPKERELALAMLVRSYTGETVEKIAERFDITRDGVYAIIKKNDDFKRFQAHIYDQLFEELFGKAVLVLHEILDTTKSPATQLKTVELILKASGRLTQETRVTVEANQQQIETQAERERRIIELEKELLQGD
jgi:predicted transcriptional regulator